MPSVNYNAIVNSLQCMCTFVQADVEYHMKKCIEEQKHFDVIMLDPPKLAITLSSIFQTNHSALYFQWSVCVTTKNISCSFFSIASNNVFNPRMFRNNIDMLAPYLCSECFIHKSLSHSRSSVKYLKLSSSGGDNTCGIDDATVADVHNISNGVMITHYDSV